VSCRSFITSMLENEDKVWVLVCCVIKWIVVPKYNEFLKVEF